MFHRRTKALTENVNLYIHTSALRNAGKITNFRTEVSCFRSAEGSDLVILRYAAIQSGV